MSDSNIIPAGIWPCVVTSAVFGDNDGSPEVQISGRITDGPAKGRNFTYQDQVNGKSALYVGRSCKAVGWKEKNLETLKADVEEWIKKTGGATTVEIRHIEIKKGKKYDAWVAGGMQGSPPVWDKPNAIGRGAKPLAPPKAETLADANEAMRRSMEAEGTAPTDAPADDDSIPFLSCAFGHEPSPIAKVLQ